MTKTESLDIAMLPPMVAADAGLTAELAGLINGVYAEAEKDLWIEGALSGARTLPHLLL